MPNLKTNQFLVPQRDLNGAVVRWLLQTIEYDDDLVNPPKKQKNFHNPVAPWFANSRVISTP